MSIVNGFCERCVKFRKEHCDGSRQCCMSILFKHIDNLEDKLKRVCNDKDELIDNMLKFFEEREGCDLGELVNDIIHNIESDMRQDTNNDDLSFDECVIMWGDKYICDASEFADLYTNSLMDNIVKTIESFRGESKDDCE